MANYCLLFVVLLFATTYAQVDWSTLTVDQLNQLPPSAFVNITAANLSSIPIEACHGFRAQQIAFLPTAAAPGFSAAQIAQIPWGNGGDGCEGFHGDFMGAMLPAAFTGLSYGCIGGLQGSALYAWTPEQLASVAGVSFMGFTAQNLPFLNAAAFTGINALQVGNLTYLYTTSGCPGLQPQQIQNIPAAAFAGFSQGCVAMLGNDSFSYINAEQFSNLSPNAASGLTAVLISTMNPTAAAGFTAATLNAMFADYTYDGCLGFNAAIVSNIPASAFSGWQTTCVNWLPSMAFSAITQYQLGNLSNFGAAGLTSYVVANIPAAAAVGFTSVLLSNVAQKYHNDGCAGFTAAQIGSMTTGAFAGWTAACLNLLPGPVFSSVTADQIANLASNAPAGMTALLVNSIPPAAAVGWTAATLSSLGSPNPAQGCSGFTSAQFNALTLFAFAGWTESCVSMLIPSIFSAITFDQFNALPVAALPGISAPQMSNIPESIFNSVDISLFSYFSTNGVSGLTPNQLATLIQQFDTSFTSLLTPLQLSGYAEYNLTAILTFKSMIPVPVAPVYNSIPFPNTTWLQLALSPAVEITQNLVDQGFSFDTLEGITAAQAPLVDVQVLKNIASNAESVYYLLPDTMNAFTCEQLNALQPANAYMLPASRDVYDSRSLACTGSTGGSTHHSSSSSGGNPHHGLTGGQVAGVVFGVLISVAIIAGVAFWVLRYRKQNSAFPPLLPMYNKENN